MSHDRNADGSVGDEAGIELLWHKYFQDPTEWWDNRKDKLHIKSPDFRHKSTKDGLWIGNWDTPQWVKDTFERQAPTK